MNDLTNKVALVTGGGTGIGLAVARAFLAAGMKVAICGRRRGRINDAARELGGDPLALTCDVGDAAQVTTLVEKVVDRFGGLDVLVNNAGISVHGPVARLSLGDWERVQRTNVTGAFLCARAAWPHLKGGGSIINIASLAGKEGFAGGAAYAASKHGLMGLTESLREEGEADRVRVAAICPGYVDTPMVAKAPVPGKVMIRPEDIAATCLYLLNLSEYAVVREIVVRRLGAD